ncbi:MAG: tetratricopeptide repeat protein [Christensenellales bacterium]|jgi:tetratricopeptide (TPR) repeat protein
MSYQTFRARCIAKKAYRYHSLGQFDKALELYAKADAMGLANVLYMTTYGNLLIQLGEYDAAIRLFDRALSMGIQGTRRLQIRMSRALAYIKQGRTAEAIQIMEDVHSKARSTVTYGTLGYMYILAGDYKKALPFTLEAMDYTDDDPVICDNLAQIYIQQGRWQDARKVLEEIYPNNKNRADILYHLALVEQQAGNLNKAADYARAALKCNMNTLNDASPEAVQAILDNCSSKS